MMEMAEIKRIVEKNGYFVFETRSPHFIAVNRVTMTPAFIKVRNSCLSPKAAERIAAQMRRTYGTNSQCWVFYRPLLTLEQREELKTMSNKIKPQGWACNCLFLNMRGKSNDARKAHKI